MNIAFVLNGPSRVAVGGHKIVFEYANEMVRRGYEVKIYFDCENGRNNHHIPKIIMFLRRWFIGKYMIKWFSLNKKVHLYPIRKITKGNVGRNDIIITTASIPAMQTYNVMDKQKKIINLIQGYERWCLSESNLQYIYQMGYKNIVISKWLMEKIKEPARNNVEYIPNGLDFSIWGIEKNIEERNSCTVAMIYSELEIKGSKYGLEALEYVKKKNSDLQVKLFGTVPRSSKIPSWIQYYENATPKEVKKIYNESAVYLNPSLGEGFGLTSIESMACGCALVTTDFDAAKEYAQNMENALVVRRKNIEEIGEAIIKLINDKKLRVQIAETGEKYVKEHFSWESSFNKFEQVINECVDE